MQSNLCLQEIHALFHLYCRSFLRKSELLEKFHKEYEVHKCENLYQSMMGIIIDANQRMFREEERMCEAIYRIAREKMQDEFLAREIRCKENTLITQCINIHFFSFFH